MTATLATRGHAARFGPNAGKKATSRPCELCGAPQRRFTDDLPVICRADRPLYLRAIRELAAERLAALWPYGRPLPYGGADDLQYDRDQWRISLRPDLAAAVTRARAMKAAR